MTFDEYKDWILTHVPIDMDVDEFIDKLAIGTIGVIEHASKSTNISVDDLVKQFYSNKPNKN